MKLIFTSVMVDDQDKALKFYTEVLGFVKKSDFPIGQFKWLTVVPPEGPGDVELVLEPNVHPAAQAFQNAMFADGIPLASFGVEDIHKEYERMKKLGVAFRAAPRNAGPVTVAVLEDTCGNLIQLVQK